MKFSLEVLLATVLCCSLTGAVYVTGPEDISMLPGNSQLVFLTIFRPDMFQNPEAGLGVFGNECQNQMNVKFLQQLQASGRAFRDCYSLSEEDVDKFIAIANEEELAQSFQEGNDKCLAESSPFYEFNCYVQQVERYLLKVHSYIHRPNNSLEWNIQYNLALSLYRRRTICTGGVLKELIEDVNAYVADFTKCNTQPLESA